MARGNPLLREGLRSACEERDVGADEHERCAGVDDRFRSAVQSGADWLNDPANREDALALIAEHTGLPAELLSNLVLPNYSTTISPELLAQQLDLFVDYGVLEQAPPLDEILATQPE